MNVYALQHNVIMFEPSYVEEGFRLEGPETIYETMFWETM